ncbi:hypothetical protein SOV_12790 [Sporomusa ovata DSM 2662]|nr:hypothetical protein SOV_1c06150 [Sporomusa ovata DSM 2662]
MGKVLEGFNRSFARKKAQLTAPSCQLSHKIIYAQNF